MPNPSAGAPHEAATHSNVRRKRNRAAGEALSSRLEHRAANLVGIISTFSAFVPLHSTLDMLSSRLLSAEQLAADESF
jgi:hypothetical protein